MSLHLQRQIDRLKKLILALGALVEESVENALRAYETRSPELAARVIEGEKKINQIEVDVEEECLHTLALHQPVALDLRYVVAVLKINADLERIADLAVNIAEQASFLANEPRIESVPYDLPGMTKRVRTMLKQSLDSLVHIDTVLAQTVFGEDDEVDQIHRDMYRAIVTAIRNNPNRTEQLIHLLNISRQLERIADHAVNIAEEVMYMASGAIMRHRDKSQATAAAR